MNWWQFCVVAMVVTACGIAFMMATANNPSADDMWRGAGGSLMAFLLGAGGKHAIDWMKGGS